MTRTRLTAWPRAAIAALILGWMVGPVAARQESHEQSRESWQRVSDIFAALGAVPGTVVADVGAGGGFFTERLARAVGPDGRVLAVDVDASALGRIADRVRAAGLTNVKTVHGRDDDPTLPAASLDGALIVNAYHEMREHQAMLTRIRDALKPTGRLVIVEPTSESGGSDGRDAQARRHQIAARFVQEDARAAGFRIVSLEEPFVQRPSRDYEYMLVLAPAVASTASVGRSGGEASSADVESAELRIAAAEFAALHRTGGVIVLDVRGPTEYARGHIPGARLAPMSDLRSLVDDLKHATVPVVAYCDCPAEETSARAALYLRKRGVSNVRALAGGWADWVASGGPVTTGPAVVRFALRFAPQPDPRIERARTAAAEPRPSCTVPRRQCTSWTGHYPYASGIECVAHARAGRATL